MSVLGINQQGQCFVRDERKLVLAHSFKTNKLGDEVSIFRGCLISNDRLLLSHNIAAQLFVSTLDGSNSNVIDLDYLPHNVTLSNKNHALVSVGEAGIQIIDLTSLKPGRRLQVDGICRGIASVKGMIWVANKAHTLTVVDINGKVLKVIQTTFDPREICVNEDGDVYCTDRNSDKVYVVTSDGKEREIYNNRDLKFAIGVALDNYGDVYVVGYVSNDIHRISNGGQKNDIVLTADDGIHFPSAISYTKETSELLVFNDLNKSINIYKAK